jgi:hypothetical protein
MDDTIQLSPPLRGQYVQILESVPVLKISTTIDIFSELSLNNLQLLDFFYFHRIPDGQQYASWRLD